MTIQFKYLLYMLCCFYSITIHSQYTPNLKIAEIKNNTFIFSKDTLEVKAFFVRLLDKTTINKIKQSGKKDVFNKIYIEKGNVINGKIPAGYDKEYYYLICRNYDLKLKVAMSLKKVGNTLILFPEGKAMSVQDTDLGLRYLICEGSDNDCYPNLYVMDNEVHMTSTSKTNFVCDPDNPCKQTVGMFDPFE